MGNSKSSNQLNPDPSKQSSQHTSQSITQHQLSLLETNSAENMHLHRLQLVAFGAYAQTSLQMLLSYFVKKLQPDEQHPSFSIVHILNNAKQELKKCPNLFTNSTNRDLVYKDVSNDVLNDCIEIKKLDATLLKSILSKIHQFPTANSHSNCMNTMTVFHQNKCCNNCNHDCSQCKNELCKNKNKCCLTNKWCEHTCNCGLNKTQCETYRYTCCGKCNLCFFCLMTNTNVTTWIELVQKLVENQHSPQLTTHSLIICEIRELKLAIEIINIYRNMTCHVTNVQCKEMDQKTFTFKMLPGMKDWSSLHSIISYAVKSVFKFLRNKNFITPHKYDTVNYNLKELLNFQNSAELLEKNLDRMGAYIHLEHMEKLMNNIMELRTTFGKFHQEVQLASLKPLIIGLTLTNLRGKENIDIKSTSTRNLKKSFNSSINAWMGYEEGSETFKIKIEECQTGSLNDQRSLTLKFKLQTKSNEIPMEVYEDDDSEESERLWQRIDTLIREHFECENISLIKWKYGSLIIHVSVYKSSPWMETEINKLVKTSIPNISDALRASYNEFMVSSFLVNQKISSEKDIYLKFKISPNHWKCGEKIHQLDEKLIKKFFQQGLDENKLEMDIKAIKTIIQQEVIKTTILDGVTETTTKNEVTETITQDEVAEITTPIEVTERTTQDEVAEIITQDEVSEITTQDKIIKTTTHDEVTETTTKYEVTETTTEDKVTEIATQDGLTETTTRNEVSKTTTPDDVTESWEYKEGTFQPTKYILFAGNPGVGKSTLLNCLMQASTKEALTPEDRFQSGISIGTGLTYQLDTKTLDGVVYMDTPGLSDVKKRKKAADAITKALKKDGIYQIVFVVTLESGRVRPDDVTTMTLVLETAKEITHYGVIFNKLGKGLLRKLNPESKMELLSQVSLENPSEKRIPVPLFLKNYAEIEDEDNALIDIPELGEFLKTLFPIRIHKNKVSDIPVDTYAAIKEKLEKELSMLRENAKNLLQKMIKDETVFLQRIDNILQQEEERFEQQKKEIRLAQEIIMTHMQEQLNQREENALLIGERKENEHELQLQQMRKQQENLQNIMARQERNHQMSLQAIANSRAREAGGCSMM